MTERSFRVIVVIILCVTVYFQYKSLSATEWHVTQLRQEVRQLSRDVMHR